ncbi:MAG TPA: aldose epimerase family protein [Prolixibacteraceae bacterium]|nr:aldose epimerase family protein [Prolixibacteraceae bacterium]
MNKFISIFLMILLAGLFSGCEKKSLFTPDVEAIAAADFQQEIDGEKTDLYTLTGEGGLAMKVTNYGARVVALCVPDKEGKPVDVVFGYKTLQEYIDQPEAFFGAVVGRYGNRIAKGVFELNGEVFQLPVNDGPNHLHGGPKGYFDVVWKARQLSDSKIEFSYVSPDGEEGYPGTLQITMSYELTADNAFSVEYVATTDKATVCNLTHHSYFNLSGEGAETINDHLLTLYADYFTPVDSTLIPTGELASVFDTPMDFTQPMVIGERADTDFDQLNYGGGYDHNWVLNKNGETVERAAKVESPVTGIVMDVLTDQPGIQFYGGNFLNGSAVGKKGLPYKYRSGLCLETQHFPDSPNKPDFPSTTLLPGEQYTHRCVYKFSTNK